MPISFSEFPHRFWPLEVKCVCAQDLCHMVQLPMPTYNTYLSWPVFLACRISQSETARLKEEGSFKVPVRLQPDADIWDIRVEWTRVRNKSSILALKGHPLTSKGSSEHCSCCLGGKDSKRREARKLLQGGCSISPSSLQTREKKRGKTWKKCKSQDEPARLQGLEAMSVFLASQCWPTATGLAEWHGSPYVEWERLSPDCHQKHSN